MDDTNRTGGAGGTGREAVEARLRRHGLDPRWVGTTPPEGAPFARLVLDSRRAGPGDLFCAVRGTRHDAHEFLPDVAGAGAAAAVVERPVALDGVEATGALPQLRVTDTRAAASHLASLFRGDPAARLDLFGVTGTNGKTTTVWILRHLLAAAGPAGALGTLGRVGPDGKRTLGELTTPGPLELMDALRALEAAGAERVAMEASSHALDQRRVDALGFRGIAFTSFSRDHLDYHRDLEGYRAAKLRLVDLLLPGGRCAVLADEPAWEPVGERVVAAGEGRRLATFGLSETADVRAAEVRFGPASSRWRLETPVGAADVRLPMPGRFNVLNALGAVALALGELPDVATLAARLGDVPPVPGRMEVLARRPALVLRDYAHTPDSYERVLGELRAAAPARLFVVFGAAGERDPGKWPVMARIAAENAERVIVTTDNPRSEDPEALARHATAGLPPDRYEVVLDRREAIARALELAGPEDVIVLLGKGHETYQIIGDRRVPFDEAAVVAELTGAPGAEGGAPDAGDGAPDAGDGAPDAGDGAPGRSGGGAG